MSYGYETSSPASIAAWFTAFETFIQARGWTIETGSGTQDLEISSNGEAGGFTKLYARIYQDGTFVRAQVQDDLVPTHTTTYALSYADAGAGAFTSWIAGDKDAFIYCFLTGGNYDTVYVGTLEPFAISPTDETYYMVAGLGVNRGALLHQHDDTWDVTINTVGKNAELSVLGLNLTDSSLGIGGVYLNDGDEIAGQLRHVSCEINAAGVSPQDTGTSSDPAGDTEWIILQDQIGDMFALKTSGALPLGWDDGASLDFTNGLAASWDAFEIVIKAFLSNIGWTITEDAEGFSAYSDGEDGTEDIWVHIWYDAGNAKTQVCGKDDLAETHSTTHFQGIGGAQYPSQYWITADKNMIIFAQEAAGVMIPLFCGMANMPQTLPDTTYKVWAGALGSGAGVFTCSLLRGHSGLWGQVGSCRREASSALSSPNLFDGTTYIIFPVYATSSGNAFGDIPYFKGVSSGALAEYDTITVGGATYTVLDGGAVAGLYALRTG